MSTTVVTGPGGAGRGEGAGAGRPVGAGATQVVPPARDAIAGAGAGAATGAVAGGAGSAGLSPAGSNPHAWHQSQDGWTSVPQRGHGGVCATDCASSNAWNFRGYLHRPQTVGLEEKGPGAASRLLGGAGRPVSGPLPATLAAWSCTTSPTWSPPWPTTATWPTRAWPRPSSSRSGWDGPCCSRARPASARPRWPRWS